MNSTADQTRLEATAAAHARELDAGERFAFGRNWRAFLEFLDDERIDVAVRSLQTMLNVDRLDGKSFLDMGSGSGLFSLAARRLGASVTSVDYDPDSVGCTAELRRRYFDDDTEWKVMIGSVLDRTFVDSLGSYDVVYSWGVLHHTGSMHRAFDNVSRSVSPGGQLFIAVYNDQGWISDVWLKVKRIYCSGNLGKIAMSGIYMPYWAIRGVLVDVVRRKNPTLRYREYKRKRGMSVAHDWRDWLGGLPFEVASPGDIVDVFRHRGFTLERLSTVGGAMGNNQFVFRKAV